MNFNDFYQLVYPAYAQGIGENIDIPGTKFGLNQAAVEALFNKLVDGIFWTAGVLAVIAIIATGILLAAAWGQPEKMAQAKKNFFWAILGMIIIIFSFVTVTGLRQIMEKKAEETPPPTDEIP